MRIERSDRVLTVIDEYTRECLAIEVARHLRSDDVLHRLTELFVEHGPPDPFAPITAVSSLPSRCASGCRGSA